MRAALLTQTIKALYSANQSRAICIEGAPGVGKTTIVGQVADSLGARLIHLHVPTLLVEDFGIPMPSNGRIEFLTPNWFPAVEGKGEAEKVIILFDDRNQCSQDLQKLQANMIQARELHGHPVPEGVMFISTGNRLADRAGTNRVLSHLRDRETVLEFEVNLDDWCSWAIEKGVDPMVVSFLRFRPYLLHDFDPQRTANATPRGWSEGVSPVLGNVPAEAEFECIKGAVGEGPAAEFVGFVRIFRKLPNPDSILLHPDTADVPADPATLYALSGALATRASESNFSRVIKYTNRMPPEFSVLTVSYATRRDKKLASTKAFTEWAVGHQDVLF